jgi:hypothetical protein
LYLVPPWIIVERVLYVCVVLTAAILEQDEHIGVVSWSRLMFYKNGFAIGRHIESILIRNWLYLLYTVTTIDDGVTKILYEVT